MQINVQIFIQTLDVDFQILNQETGRCLLSKSWREPWLGMGLAGLSVLITNVTSDYSPCSRYMYSTYDMYHVV